MQGSKPTNFHTLILSSEMITKKFYGILEEAVRRTVYKATIKPFQRLADGRGSYLALIAQHAGQEPRPSACLWKGLIVTSYTVPRTASSSIP